jgi:hypothetical protein
MSEDRVIKKLYMSKPEGRRSVDRPLKEEGVLIDPKCDGFMT